MVNREYMFEFPNTSYDLLLIPFKIISVQLQFSWSFWNTGIPVLPDLLR